MLLAVWTLNIWYFLSLAFVFLGILASVRHKYRTEADSLRGQLLKAKAGSSDSAEPETEITKVDPMKRFHYDLSKMITKCEQQIGVAQDPDVDTGVDEQTREDIATAYANRILVYKEVLELI